MKFSAALSMAVAPLALAKAINNVYPGRAIARHEDTHKDDGASALVDLSASSSSKEVEEIILIWVNPGNQAATTTLNDKKTVTVTQTVKATDGSNSYTTVGAAAAVTHTVTVGGSAGLVYTPDTIEANVGDMVVFTFMSENHTVTQSAFTTPCEKLAGGMDSGFQPNPNNTVKPPPQVAMQVMVATPLWFYCRQSGHCGKGMTFSINPTANKTQADFQAMAIAQNGTASAASSSSGTSSGSGSSTKSVAAAPPAVTSSSSSSNGVSYGSGSSSGGSCTCAVICAAGSFPAVQAQGVGSFGGMAGGIAAAVVAGTM